MRCLAVCALLLSIVPESDLMAANSFRKITAEFDPVATGYAVSDASRDEVSASSFGGRVDFNFGGAISTGPEFWTASYVLRGTENGDSLIRREDLWPSERHKISGRRIAWNFCFWEVLASMRGWYTKLAYSLTEIESRANRYTENSADGEPLGSGDITVYLPPDEETDYVNEQRHGVALGFGQRWLFFAQRMSATLEMSYTVNIKRSVNVASKDPRARGDYDEVIDLLSYTRFSQKPFPEASFTMGYSF